MTKGHRTIDKEIAEQILKLHKTYPNLGHEGLWNIFKQDYGIDLDETDLRIFMKEKKLGPGPTGKHVAASGFSVGPLWLSPHASAGNTGDTGGESN
jgi:hypothetical protein